MEEEKVIRLNKFIPRSYQIPIFDAIENKGYRKVLAILPRRCGKDISSWNLLIREALKKVGTYWHCLPTLAHARKVIFDAIDNDGNSFLSFIPPELIASKNASTMSIKLINGSHIQLVGSNNFNCYDDKTEILTEDGWKLFKDLNRNELVATLSDGKLVYEKPSKYMEYDYDGLMYNAQNSSIDFCVTPNHRFWVRSTKGVYKFKEISNPTICHDRIPSQCIWEGEYVETIMGYKSEDFMALLGIWLSEGSTYRDAKNYRISISQIKQDVRSKIKTLLESMNIHFAEYKDHFVIHSKSLYLYFSQFGKQIDRFIPKEIKMLNKHLLSILFEWLVLGDGTRTTTYTGYYSISKKLIDDVQEIIIKLGLSGNVRQRKQNISTINGRLIIPKHTLYMITVRTSKFKSFLGANNKKYIHTAPYKGSVYCVSVGSGVIKVRRNGKEMWCGNSLIGTNARGIIFSEYSVADPRAYQFLRPVLNANNGWAIFLSTPRSRNHLYDLWKIAQDNPQEWFSYRLTVDDTKHMSIDQIHKEIESGEISYDLAQQEYWVSWDLGVEGAYYTKIIDRMKLNNQITKVPWDPEHKVYTSWDLGWSDPTVIVFFQLIGHSIHVIDHYKKSFEPQEHFAKVVLDKPYVYGGHIFPHDVRVHETQTGLSRLNSYSQLGIHGQIAPSIGLDDGIEKVRSSMNRMFIDDVKCADLIKSLESYRQVYDATNNVYSRTPLRNWATHDNDAVRYMCISLDKLKSGMTEELANSYRNEALYGSPRNMPDVFKDPMHW